MFLSEQVVVSDGDPIVFSSIPQGYMHLVVELLGAAVSDDDDSDLLIYWNGGPDGSGSYGYSGRWIWGDTGSFDGNFAETTDAGEITAKYVIPSGTAHPGQMASVHLEFPYYSLADVQKNMMWRSSGLDYALPAMVNALVLYTDGGGVRDITETAGSGDPISELTFAVSGEVDWKAESRAALFGIKHGGAAEVGGDMGVEWEDV